MGIAAGVLVIVVFGLVAGVALVVAGLWGRRVGEAPMCRRCGFDLSGARPAGGAAEEQKDQAGGAAVCPECGADLAAAGAVATGAWRPRRAALAVGGASVLASVAVLVLTGVTVLGGPGFHRLKPTGLILMEARIASTARADELGAELARRHGAGEVSDVPGLIDGLLDLQGDRRVAWSLAYGDLLEQAGMDPEQAARFERQVFVIEPRVRSRVRVGRPIPVHLEVVGVRSGTNTDVEVYAYVHDASVGGAACTFSRPPGRGEPATPRGVTNLRAHAGRYFDTTPCVLIAPPPGLGPGRVDVSWSFFLRTGGGYERPEPEDDGWVALGPLAVEIVEGPTVSERPESQSPVATPGRSPPRLVTFVKSADRSPPMLGVTRIATDASLAHRLVLVYPDGEEIRIGWYCTGTAPHEILPIDTPPDAEAMAGLVERWQPVYAFQPGGSIDGRSMSLDRRVPLTEGVRLVLRPDPWFAEMTIGVDTLDTIEIDLGEVELKEM